MNDITIDEMELNLMTTKAVTTVKKKAKQPGQPQAFPANAASVRKRRRATIANQINS